ncbi:hypothetical protein H4W79_002764 [Nocardiopsis terrae]|uniref:Lipoprotein n=1 Tax=Nocardiopsis terrae TaxID=372655 RepID=A0ABR9HI80_9ACTN|nr:hypothetical protein [Nocardiopsis terrae]MBE1458550.1 hypothetical protein [Nocardiopsis terrae]
MGVRSTAVTASMALLLCATLTSCSTEEAPEQEADTALLELEQAADALSVTILRPGAERAFARKGHPVDGSLSCTTAPADGPSPDPSEGGGESVTADGARATAADQEATEGAPRVRGGRLEVFCTGQSRTGEQVSFEGRLRRGALAEREEGDDSLRGDFTGRVDGEEVFAMDCFQCSPTPSQASEGDGG